MQYDSLLLLKNDGDENETEMILSLLILFGINLPFYSKLKILHSQYANQLLSRMSLETQMD